MRPHSPRRALALPSSLLLLACLNACVMPKQVVDDLADADHNIELANKVYAKLCAPEQLAQAEAQAAFTRVELKQGSVKRAGDHATLARAAALSALEIATPCGGIDRDGDTVPDIVDRCPHEKEDLDGDRDEDGCRDLDPTGDEDGDGIVNIDDSCVDEPEDFDGDSDEDGCPETSEDRDGDRIIDAVDQCPDEAEDLDGFKDTDGCPDTDNDGDGLVDTLDRCPMLAEDTDGWDDDDGCPDPDNDGDGLPDDTDQCPNEKGERETNGCPSQDADKDGIADANDKCPTEPETVNGYLDADGCPDTPPGKVKVTTSRVEISETIQFETGSATLLASSNGVLDDVVQVLKDAPAMRLRIEGHTDSEGSDESNLKLSTERATSVLAYLTRKGVEAARVEAVGFGETRPIDTNRTTAGKARNRRVEFHIIPPG